jgi:hypothetical protein
MPSQISSHQAPTLRPVTSPDSPSPRPRTSGQRWKARRDLVIVIASANGASQRLLGDVFDLPHSRICAILKKHRARYPRLARPAGSIKIERKTAVPGTPETPETARRDVQPVGPARLAAGEMARPAEETCSTRPVPRPRGRRPAAPMSIGAALRRIAR